MKVERSELLEPLTQLVITYISGEARRRHTIGAIGRSDRLTRHETQAENFCSLVEAHFREDLSVSDYGTKLGVSAPHLTRVCKSVLGFTPNELVRQRRLLEAKRLLEYTRLPISEGDCCVNCLGPGLGGIDTEDHAPANS
ncbi:helix-turn-helix domain-containing protein [Sulfitobacter porphyrae]|uniref:Helix-turn-helix domain-containing protein n=1 Tax=Sulfitobacter porphyrae TaxID=1246864 RepID=A0ABW2B6T1_9RHOB